MFILPLITIIISCAPLDYVENNKDNKIIRQEESVNLENETSEAVNNLKKIDENKTYETFDEAKISNEVEIILPLFDNLDISNDFINAFELSLYEKNIKNIKLNINKYSNSENLKNIISHKASPGKIFIGPLTSKDTQNLSKECSKGILFFSFASNRKYSGDCVYLVNFFPEDDLTTLFNYFEPGSKIALLYPENDYGYYINSIIDPIATSSNSIIINRASYKEDLSNARGAIKELSKYELRKYELDRQKEILRLKNDEVSKKALKKIEKFETAGVVDFTHLLLPDYSIRLLQIAPLLPFYDIDPNKVQFVGTGVWDNSAFFDEPSLQGAIFPGIEEGNRSKFIDEYKINYKNKPTRTITIPYDLTGIVEYIINQDLNLGEIKELLDNEKTTFDGIDGKFSFKNKIIFRELNILEIMDGKTILLD